MSKLSKLLVMAFVIVAVIAMSISVNAYTNNDLKEYINGVHNVNNMIFELSIEQKQIMNNYLTAHPVSDEVATSIKSDIDAIESKIAATGATNVSQISNQVKTEVIALAQSAGSKAGLNITVNTSAKTVTVSTKSGENLFSTSYVGKVKSAGTSSAQAASTTTTTTSGSTLLYTGANYAVYALPVLAIVAVAIVAKKRA